MKSATRTLRAVASGGPRKRTVLAALAEHHGAPDGEAVVAELVRSGALVMYGKKRGATWGAPRGRKAAA